MRVVGILAPSGWRWSLPGGRLLTPLAGAPLVVRSARALAGSCDALAVIVPADVAAATRAELATAGIDALVLAAATERWRSLALAVTELGPSSLVISHDAYRPLASPELFARVVTEASASGAAACGLALESSIAETDAEGRAVRISTGQHLWLVQTPQAFVTGLLQDGLEAVAASAARGLAPPADEATTVQLAGGLVQLVAGESGNRELAGEEDLSWVEATLSPSTSAR